MQQVGDGIWIQSGGDVKFLIFPFPTRMTVVRLSSGKLWVHSPVDCTDDVARAVGELGEPCVLIAPNEFHHMFIADWRARWPEAQLYAVPGLAEKRRDLAIDGILDDNAPALWASDIAQTVFRGNRLTDEAIFFHRPSRTLILTDLMVNVRVAEGPLAARALARWDQVAYPHGGAPRLFRWTMKDKAQARRAIQTAIDWAPDQIIISHGEWYPENGTETLRQKFAWLLRPEGG